MAILALGVSYRSAPIELLERLSFGDDDLAKVLGGAGDLDPVEELTILSTCNRVELYASVPNYHAGFLALKRVLAESRGVDPSQLDEPLYSHYDDQAAEHLFAVAAGLDSMVLGEPQIGSQVREALKRAEQEGAAGRRLTGLFHAATRAGRRVRTETAVGAAPDAFVETGADLAQRRLGSLGGRALVVVGAGQMAALAVKHLRRRGVGVVRILNRSLEHARSLAERTSAEHGELDALPDALGRADLLVTATGAAGTIVEPASVLEALRRRDRPGPLVVLDLAVPRDVDPAVAELPGVDLITTEHLRAALEERETDIPDQIARAREIVDEEVRRFRVRRHSERLAPLIKALRTRGDEVTAGELERFASRLGDLTPDERDAVEGLARGIVAKLLHEPIVRLKERSASGTDDQTVRLLVELFGLDLPE
jgi:glutamyl-tRNA reductase